MICAVCDTDVEVMGDKFVHHGDCPGGFARTKLAGSTLESRYTEPREDCPHPERWHSDDWDSAEHEVTDLVASLVNALRPDFVIETGTAHGQTAAQIGTVLAAAGVGWLISYEINPDRAEAARKRCDGLPVEVRAISSLDEKVDDEWTNTVGFAWFDSAPMFRVPEFRHFYPALAPGALVAFHDTAPHHGAELWQGILGLEEEGVLLPIRLRTPRGLVVGEVVKGGGEG